MNQSAFSWFDWKEQVLARCSISIFCDCFVCPEEPVKKCRLAFIRYSYFMLVKYPGNQTFLTGLVENAIWEANSLCPTWIVNYSLSIIGYCLLLSISHNAPTKHQWCSHVDHAISRDTIDLFVALSRDESRFLLCYLLLQQHKKFWIKEMCHHLFDEWRKHRANWLPKQLFGCCLGNKAQCQEQLFGCCAGNVTRWKIFDLCIQQ